MTCEPVATIGHGSASFGLVRVVLESNSVDTIIDVRSQPYSRHAPDFNRGTIESLTAGTGIGYRWMGESLGGRPGDPALVRGDGSLDVAVITASAAFRAGILAVVGLAEGGSVVLLCAEEDPAHCHRASLIAPAVEEAGLSVVHLRHDGTAQAHQPSLGI
ncbi:DUF488 domain-containing protein [bacterium]|nr:DUF488 domain-containing protein [bacterium]